MTATKSNLISSLLTCLPISSIVLLLDWLSKNAVRESIPLMQSNPGISGLFQLTHVQNTGAAWSAFNAFPEALTGISIIFCSVLIITLVKYLPANRVLQIAWGLAFGGALGNLIDRILYRSVTDFIDLQFIPNYPVFNIADIALVSAACLLILYYVFNKKQSNSNCF